MAILEEKRLIGNGIVKELEESAMELILQNLQEDHYQYPEKAFIREITSNCTDSIDEKSVARSILSGEAKVEDHYSTNVDKLTKDSEFDSSYFDLKYLNPKDEIKIIYENREGSRDRISISDTGVGLGGSRLQGYFRPAYSTKRLNKKALGKFGIGAKAGLATGVESYQIMSRHNGREFNFDIYRSSYFSTTPKFNDSGEINPHEIWKVKKRDSAGELIEVDEIVYYTKTTEYNCVITSIDVKNPIRKKHTYFEAIKTQLAYFKDVEVVEIDIDGYERTHNIAAEILYQDDSIIIPKEKYYNVPHIVLNNVIYGPADYAEMELTEPQCSIGMVLDPSSVDVNRAREAVRWTDKTREAILNHNTKVKDIAFSILTGQVSEANDDFLKWVRVCKDIRMTSNNDTILNRLSGLVDTSDVDFEFPGSEGLVKFSVGGFKTMFKGFTLTKTLVNKHDDGTFTTGTTTVKDWSDFTAKNLYLRTSVEHTIKSIKMGFISENLVDGNAVYLLTPNPKELEDLSFAQVDRVKARMKKIKEILNLSNDGVMYDNIEPTDEFLTEYESKQKKKDEKVEKEAKEAAMTAAEIRKRDGKMLYHRIVRRGGKSFGELDSYSTTRRELSIEEFEEEFSKDTTIFLHKNDLPLAKALIHIFPNTNNRATYHDTNYGQKHFDLIMVSKDSAKFVRQHATYIMDAIQKVENNKISVMNPIQKYITSKLFFDALKTLDYSFLEHFQSVDVKVSDVFSSLKTFSENYRAGQDIKDGLGSSEIEGYFSRLIEFQTAIVSGATKDEVSAYAETLFGNKSLDGCHVVLMNKFAEFKALEDYITPIKGLLRGVNVKEVDNQEIIKYLEFKGVAKFSEYLNDRYEEFNIPDEDRMV